MAFGDLTVSGLFPRLQQVDGIGAVGGGSGARRTQGAGGEGGGGVVPANYNQYDNSLEHGFSGVHTGTLPGGTSTTLGKKLNIEW